ncbi:MAG: NlpC/P60 family protein [Erysipelotrichaceae bacterium]|nr:NlpC/P60 family protein [Erysipelotrichaceae bacterium]
MKAKFTQSLLSVSTALLLATGVINPNVLAAPANHNHIVNKSLKPTISGLDGTSSKYKTDSVQDAVKKTGFTEINGKTYYLEGNGSKHTGLLNSNQGTYYFNESGEMIENEIVEINNDPYSFDANGLMETDVTKGNYYFDQSGKGQADPKAYDKIAEAALSQLGVNQDCTMLVTNSLKAVGIDFHSAPAGYLSLGETTDQPVPGDIIVYQGHVAIYIGDGQAVHGGWNGFTTAIFSVNCSTPFVAYVHPTLPLN